MSEHFDAYAVFFEPFKAYLWESGLWFLNCLFCCHVILAIVVFLYKRFPVCSVLISVTVSFAVMFYINQNREIDMFWEFQIALVMQFYMFVGFLFKQQRWLDYISSKIKMYVFICLYIGIILVFYKESGVFDVRLNNYGDVLLYVSLSFLGIFILSNLSVKIKSNLLALLGKQSLIIYIFHVALGHSIKALFRPVVNMFGVFSVGMVNSIVDYIAFFGSVSISLLVACLLTRYCPCLIGKYGQQKALSGL